MHRFATTDGLTCEAWYMPCESEDKPTSAKGLCLMFHGFAASKASLLSAAEAFHELGYDVLLVDFRGSGGSDGYATTIGYREADDVAAACDLAGGSGRSAVGAVWALMGGAAVLRALAVGESRPAAVILECPFDRLLRPRRTAFAVGLPSFPAAELLVFWGGVQHGYSGFDHNPVEYAAAVECPTLFLHGERDARVAPAEAREVFDRLGGKKTWACSKAPAMKTCRSRGAKSQRAAVERFLIALQAPQAKK